MEEKIKKANDLAKTRNRILLIMILSDTVFCEERINGDPEKGAAYEFACNISELDSKLDEYINSYPVTKQQ